MDTTMRFAAAVMAQLWGAVGKHGWVGWGALVLMLGFIAWLLTSFASSLRGRTRLQLELRDRRIGWVSFADTYADEKQYDRTLAIEFATRLGEQGIPVRIASTLIR